MQGFFVERSRQFRMDEDTLSDHFELNSFSDSESVSSYEGSSESSEMSEDYCEKLIKEANDISYYSCLLFNCQNNSNSRFFNMPSKVLAKIVCNTIEPGILTRDNAEQLSRKVFSY